MTDRPRQADAQAQLSAPVPVPADVRLDGRVVVVTGAAVGIGRATAMGAAAFGARVAICDRDGERLVELVRRISDPTGGLPRSGGATARGMPVGVSPDERVLASVLDVRDVDAVAAFADEVGVRFGTVHGLVNNVGGTFRSAFSDLSDNGTAALVAENFTSVVGVTRAFLPLLGDGSSIVNVTSSEAFQAAPGFAVYAAMKAAVENLTKSLALELAERGIRVNSVAPDGIPTAADAALAASVASESAYVPPPVPPLGRFAPPEECASVIVFLLGELSRFVTGSTVHVDGGLHAAGGWHHRPTSPET